MASLIPIRLEGSSLGVRHKQFNGIVNEAFQQKVDLQSALEAEEKYPLDRLFKIDLASKYRDVDHILHVLQDDDMLYVTRALKSRWLLEPQYRDIINPRHLEDELFPNMIQPAVNKMRHWLQKNLTDKPRCQEFYYYYKDRPEIAIKFLWHCSPDYIMAEMKSVLHKLSPQDLKVLCESCSQAAIIYYEGLEINEEALLRNKKNEEAYFKSIQCVLKKNSELYLDIVEKYFRVRKFAQLSPEATRYVMKNHKDRFNAKAELYTAYIFHINALSFFLNSKEAKNLVLKLAKAEDIISFNIFHLVEPIIKRVRAKERESFKKLIFVQKAYGNKLKEWPYPIPTPLIVVETNINSIFKDKEHEPSEYEEGDIFTRKRPHISGCGTSSYSYDHDMGYSMSKTPLDILFDKYRFKGFNETYRDLYKKLSTESSVTGRMNIFLVLVSKCGGVPDQLAKLLKLLTKYENDTSNLRAAVVRSLVKRAAAWRLPDKTWNMMMKFGHGLGLDGNVDNLQCVEGLHAVVLRTLLKNEDLTEDIQAAFLNEPSTFKEYKLKSDESRLVAPKLANILLDSDPEIFLKFLTEYNIKVKNIPGAEMILVEKARSDHALLCRLYTKRIGRRYFLKETFTFHHRQQSFINALRHDTDVLDKGKMFALITSRIRPSHDRFLKSLALYFNEPKGLAEQHRIKLIGAMKVYPQPWFARVINILSTNVPLSDLLHEVSVIRKKEIHKALNAAFRATTHKTRPFLYIKGVDREWLEWLGAKAVANKVLICREKDREYYTKLLLQWRRTVRIALRLGLNSKFSTETFIAASKLRPAVALKIADKIYLRNKTIDPEIWKVIKQLIQNIISKKTSKFLCHRLRNNNNVPQYIKVEYWETLYEAFKYIDKKKSLSILCRLENMQTAVDQDLIRGVVEIFIDEELVATKFTDDHVAKRDKCLYVRILAKYLLTATSKEEQEERLKNTCDVFFEKIRTLKDAMRENNQLCSLYDMMFNFVQSLKYNKAFLGDYAPNNAVFERVLENIQKILPKERYFALHLEAHLIMIYYVSLQQSIEQNPIIFADLEQNWAEATEIVGRRLGKNIGADIREYTTKYNFSIIEIYKKILVQYLDGFSVYSGHNAIMSPVFKSLLEVGQTQSLLLAEHVAKHRDFSLSKAARDELTRDLKIFNNATVNFFLNAK